MKSYKVPRRVLDDSYGRGDIKTMPYVVKKAVQDYARRNNMKVSADFYAAMDKQIDALLVAASTRCKDNKRKTLKAYDL